MKPETGIAVDASMRGGKVGAKCGIVEWRGVDLATGKEVFRSEIYPEGGINQGELMAIMDGVKYAMDNGHDRVYSDSMTAISWAKKPSKPPKMEVTPASLPLCQMIWSDLGWAELSEVQAFIQSNVKHWHTKEWNENPADLGYKGYQKKAYFAVKVGRVPGVYGTWKECAEQITGYPAARFKGFLTIQDAEDYLKGVEVSVTPKRVVRKKENLIASRAQAIVDTFSVNGAGSVLTNCSCWPNCWCGTTT